MATGFKFTGKKASKTINLPCKTCKKCMTTPVWILSYMRVIINNGKSSIAEERILWFVFVPSIV
jgi:hypothetical protein